MQRAIFHQVNHAEGRQEGQLQDRDSYRRGCCGHIWRHEAPILPNWLNADQVSSNLPVCAAWEDFHQLVELQHTEKQGQQPQLQQIGDYHRCRLDNDMLQHSQAQKCQAT